MKVLKFGGSSLADATRYQTVAQIVSDYHQASGAAVVLSAPKGVTNALSLLTEQAAKGKDFGELLAKLDMTLHGIINELAEQLSNFEKAPLATLTDTLLSQLKQRLQGIQLLACAPDNITASIMSLGEYVSVQILSSILASKNIPNQVIDPVDFMVADGPYLDALAILDITKANYQSLAVATQQVIIMPGFVAANAVGDKVTLGRNGSDYSAAILAACMDAEVCEIWTDVDGVYNADPRQVENAVLMDKLTYEEAMELSYFGAKVLHPKTIGPIAQYNIPCLIKNTLNPSAPGTLISNEKSDTWTTVKGISQLDDVVMFNVAGPGMKGMVGMAARIFDELAAAHISISLITQSSSEYSISFCLPAKDKEKALTTLEDAFVLELDSHLLEPIEVREDLSIVTLVGDGMRQSKGMAARFFNGLAQARINNIAIAQGSSERSISTVVESHKAKKAIKAVHQNFFSQTHHLDVFLVGVGLVGSELLEQINRQQANLRNKGISLKVFAVSNSRQTLLRPGGIDLDSDWGSELAHAETLWSLETLQNFVEEQGLINPVFVDCTSAEQVAEQYVDLMAAGFHIVTPNKKANTASFDYYQALQQTAQDNKRQFLYETTVGAGLPVIENLQKLVMSGDEVQTFEGILSGSLSYVFGLLDDGVSLSAATIKAKENGYTEPDPRDDLSGMDVARKLLIMAREAGMQLELSDIKVESVLPSHFDDTGSVAEFMTNLPSIDAEINAKVSEAQANGAVLRYVGEIIDGQCQVNIKMIPRSHPLAAVRDGENALAINSLYYSPIPFVIRGYGAGATVTAAGVFSDILRAMAWTEQ